MLKSEQTIRWSRVQLVVVGQGRAGKTAMTRSLQNQTFEDTASTAGVDTATVETTALHDWKQMDASHTDKVTLLVCR